MSTENLGIRILEPPLTRVLGEEHQTILAVTNGRTNGKYTPVGVVVKTPWSQPTRNEFGDKGEVRYTNVLGAIGTNGSTVYDKNVRQSTFLGDFNLPLFDLRLKIATRRAAKCVLSQLTSAK